MAFPGKSDPGRDRAFLACAWAANAGAHFILLFSAQGWLWWWVLFMVPLAAFCAAVNAYEVNEEDGI